MSKGKGTVPPPCAPHAEKGGVRLADRIALRPAEAADALGISERTLRTLMPLLPFVRLGGVVLLPLRDLERWLSEQARAQVDAHRERVDDIVREGLKAIGGRKLR